MCIDPMLAAHDNVTLLTGAYVSRLGTDPTGRRVDAVHVDARRREEVYTADTVVVACGALSSALLLLRSASERIRTASPTARTRSAATTCATI